MRARWVTFAVGLWLILAPLLLGYPTVAAVLHDVALGMLVCVGTLAALEWPRARFAVVVPGLWLAIGTCAVGWDAHVVASNQLLSGVAILALALVPSGKVAPARAPAKMAV